ncbi:MAG: glutamate formimidoyltransferase [bacterium]|nr:glutamate formimidoyltransferase [bacterium]
MKLIECVPNFSEGRDSAVIKQITDALTSVNGSMLLDVDMGADTNRTVVTFIGTPDSVVESAFLAIKKASELIDMRSHRGEHPRMGATDVCPLIPVNGVTVEECVEVSKKLAKRVADELFIPVYLYEYSATKQNRKSLANIREGEYEGFKEKINLPEWKPDFGEPKFNEKSGATVIGVRDFLIAYNINLNTRDAKLATTVANAIREKGSAKKDANGKIVKNEKGETVFTPGRLKECRAIGWYIDMYKVAQISINLTNWKVTPPHIAYETAAEEAAKIGLMATGSELVGLIPKDALIQAGEYFLKKQGKSAGVPERELIHIAVKSLGLDHLYPFDIDKKVIEYAYRKSSGGKHLAEMKINDFCDELSTDSPAPGGGSVAALNGAIASSLVSMVASLTFMKKGYEKDSAEVEKIASEAQRVKDAFLNLIDDDTEAFNAYMAAFKMPKKTDIEAKRREELLEEATKAAIEVPLKTMKQVEETLHLMDRVSIIGNVNSISDAGVAAINALGCAEGAYMNVLINLKNLKDEKYCSEKLEEADKLLDSVKITCEKVKNQVYSVIRR